jgi:hypothetical protein
MVFNFGVLASHKSHYNSPSTSLPEKYRHLVIFPSSRTCGCTTLYLFFISSSKSINTYSFLHFLDLWTHGLVEVISYDLNIHKCRKSQNLVVFPFADLLTRELMEVIFYVASFHEFKRSQYLVFFSFAD